MRKLGMLIATVLCLLAIGSGLDRGFARLAAGGTVDECVKSIVAEHLDADHLDITELTMAFEEECKIESGDAVRFLRGTVKVK